MAYYRFAEQDTKETGRSIKIDKLEFVLVENHHDRIMYSQNMQEHYPYYVLTMINDWDITTHYRVAEYKYALAEKEYHGYAHMYPKSLYDDLIQATIPGSYIDELGVFPVCCPCGEPGCWTTTFHVEDHGNFIVWNKFSKWHRDWDMSRLRFVFDKSAYQKELDKLRAWAENPIYHPWPMKPRRLRTSNQ